MFSSEMPESIKVFLLLCLCLSHFYWEKTFISTIFCFCHWIFSSFLPSPLVYLLSSLMLFPPHVFQLHPTPLLCGRSLSRCKVLKAARPQRQGLATSLLPLSPHLTLDNSYTFWTCVKFPPCAFEKKYVHVCRDKRQTLPAFARTVRCFCWWN